MVQPVLHIEPLLICPVCKNKLAQKGKAYCCKKGHSFDPAASGYLHLLPANKKNSKIPGDNKQMVAARRSFLSKGFYLPISQGLNQAVLFWREKLAMENPVVLDAGCGEGYYTARLWEALRQQGCNGQILGVDISKFAVQSAAKANKEILYAVASAFDLPVASASCDILVSMFAPVAIEEFTRVLKKGGLLIFAVTSTRHLWELKEKIYDTPYENKKENHQYPGFTFLEKRKVNQMLHLPTQEDVANLFTMTPYYYKSSVETTARVHSLPELDTQIDVDILIYRKK